MKRLFKYCICIPRLQEIFICCPKNFLQPALAFPGCERAEMQERLPCHRVKKRDRSFVFDFVRQFRHVLGSKARGRLAHGMAMSFLFSLPRSLAHVIEFDNEMLHVMGIPSRGTYQIE